MNRREVFIQAGASLVTLAFPFPPNVLDYYAIKQKALLEDAFLIYRIEHAPYHHIFYVD